MMTFQKMAVLAFALTSAGIVARPALAAEELVGYVNLQRAIVEVEDGKKAKKQLEQAFQTKQTELRAKEADLEAMKKRLEAANLKEDDPKAREQVLEFQRKFNELRQTLVAEQEALKKQENAALGEITQKLQSIIKDVGKKGGYTMIMEVQGASILFAKPHLDITNQVIRLYNQQSKKRGPKRRRKK